MARPAVKKIRVATMGWIFIFATRKPLNRPHRPATAIPAITPTKIGVCSSLSSRTCVTPKPASSMQHRLPARLITEPTEISVPAEADTTSVMPMARMAASLPRLRISMIRPYRAPSFSSNLKNSKM